MRKQQKMKPQIARYLAGELLKFGKPDAGWYILDADIDNPGPIGPFRTYEDARQKRDEVEMSTTDLDTVTLLASGYDWTCPMCEENNHTIEAKERVKCQFCDSEFVTVVEHAI